MTNSLPNLLMVAGSEADANMFYATRFLAGDPFIFLRLNGLKVLVMSDLEIGRARDEAKVDEILSLSEVEKRVRQKGIEAPHGADIIYEILCERGIKELTVPANFGIELADRLREKGVRLQYKKDPFFEERTVKTPQEIAAMEQTQRFTESAFDAAVQILRGSTIEGDRVLYEGKPLTAEFLRFTIASKLLERHCIAKNTIVACGDQGCDPHNSGSGAIRPHQSIVFDIFPRSAETLYCADMSRTVVKGKASPELQRMYAAVQKAQERGFELIRDGADGKDVHAAVAQVLEEQGYKTGSRNGKMEGFFHGTGHGIGLDVHEAPGLGRRGSPLQTGNVVTNEPGLYYFGIGAVRIEDMCVVEKNGCRNLTRAPKILEIP